MKITISETVRRNWENDFEGAVVHKTVKTLDRLPGGVSAINDIAGWTNYLADRFAKFGRKRRFYIIVIDRDAKGRFKNYSALGPKKYVEI